MHIGHPLEEGILSSPFRKSFFKSDPNPLRWQLSCSLPKPPGQSLLLWLALSGQVVWGRLLPLYRMVCVCWEVGEHSSPFLVGSFLQKRGERSRKVWVVRLACSLGAGGHSSRRRLPASQVLMSGQFMEVLSRLDASKHFPATKFWEVRWQLSLLQWGVRSGGRAWEETEVSFLP